MSDRNELYYEAIGRSRFGSISRLAEHLGLSYRNVESYALFEHRSVDRHGIVKYDIAAICDALECSLEDLFPDEFIDRPYRVRDSYDDGYGQRRKKVPVQRVFRERNLTQDQIATILEHLSFSRQVMPDIRDEFILDIVRRLKPRDYQALSHGLAIEGDDNLANHEGSSEEKALAFEKAIKALNSPFNFRKLQKLKGRDFSEPQSTACKTPKTSERKAALEEIRRFFKAGIEPGRLFEGADNIPQGLSPYGIQLWFQRKYMPVPAEHLKFVLSRCNEIKRNEREERHEFTKEDGEN